MCHQESTSLSSLKTSVPARTANPSDNLERAVLFVVLAVMVLPIINACAKFLSSYSVVQITWARYAGHFLFMLLVFAPHHGLDLLRSTRLSMQLIRSSLHCASAILTFYALGFVALPTATAISFSAPLMVTALAPLVLEEKVRLVRWLAVGAGFIGALVVVRPGVGGQDWAITLLLVNAAVSAVIQLMSRKLAQHDGAAVSNTYMVLVGFVLMSIPLPFIWRTPTEPVDLLVFIGIGVSGGVGHYLLVRAFELAPAAFVSPFTYGQILGATLISYLVFGQLPDAWTWAGAAIIVASGLFILHRERRSKAARVDQA
ncbi:DMT family transporter [Microvirga roseola]|uniref:DMT family transporter n=1 Tax=Microvirga roseola TaxID=2883126 RepID=UPI001E292117|nr:DMT family transporter [Microvirga roseola]